MTIKDNKPTFSFSAWQLFSHCPYLFEKQYVQGFSSTGVVEQREKGSAIHYLLAKYAMSYAINKVYPDYSELDLYAKEWANSQLESSTKGMPEEIVSLLEDQVYSIAHESIDIAKRSLEYFGLQDYDILIIDDIPAIEYEFFLPLPDGYNDFYKSFHGLIDLVVRKKDTGETLVVDFKTTKSLKSDEAEQVRIQLGLYQYVLQQIGIKIDGTRTFQIISKPLGKPEVLKSGKMSRKFILTTWENYKNELLANNMDPEEYEFEMIEKLAQVELFRMTDIYRTQMELINLWHEVFLPVVSEVTNLIEERILFRRHLNSFLCPSCVMNSVCLGELRGDDMKWVLDNHFTKREDKDVDMVEQSEDVVV